MQTDDVPDREETAVERDPFFQPTRRSVLLGVGALALAAPARADPSPTNHYVLDFLDKSRRQVVVLFDVTPVKDPDAAPDTKPSEPKFLLSWDRREFGPTASFKIERKSERYFPDGEPKKECDPKETPKIAVWLPTRWILTVENASFPGAEGKRFTAVFTFARANVSSVWEIAATVTKWWNPQAKPLAVKPAVNLAHFLDREAALAFKVENSDRNALLKSLFGERIEARTDFDLRVNAGLEWSIDAGQRNPDPLKATSRLYVLGIPLEFGGLKLSRIRSDFVVASDQRAAETRGEGPNVGQQGKVTPRAGADRQLFEAEVIHGRPAKVDAGVRPDGLYGAMVDITGFTHPNVKTPAADHGKKSWEFDFATKQFPAHETAVSVEIDKAAVGCGAVATTVQDSSVAVVAAIRHWGYPIHTVAGCVVAPSNDARSIGRLTVRHAAAGGNVFEGPFEFCGFEIVRQQQAKLNSVVTRLSIQPATKESAVDLQIGTLCVAGLPAISERPGAAPRVPPIVVQASEAIDADDKNRRILSAFSGRLALCNASIVLPERVEVGAVGKAAVPVPGNHITRLEFRDADAELYLPALGPPPVTSADAVIPIGPALAPAKVVFDLGRACLSVLRPSDLLALKFRFLGLELVAPWPPVAGGAAELAPRGGRSPGRPPAQANGASTATRDERPLLVVDFPPQHVVERAYFRQIPQIPDLPELTSDDANQQRFGELKLALSGPKHRSSVHLGGEPPEAWRNWVTALLQQFKKADDDVVGTTRDERVLLRQQLRAVSLWPSDDFLFSDNAAVAGIRRKTLLDFDQRFYARTCGDPPRENGKPIGPRGAPLPEEQRYYAGTEFLDPDARRIAWEVLAELKKEEDSQIKGAPSTQDFRRAAPLPDAEWNSIFQPLVATGKLERAPSQDWPDLKTIKDRSGEAAYEAIFVEVELARERRDRDYAAFRARYHLLASAPANSVPKQHRDYHGPKWFSDVIAESPGKLDAFITKLREPDPAAGDQEEFKKLVPARLSGPSRIAFRIDCDDYEADRAGGRIPFTLEGLTNWGGMDMAVVRRAERLMEPLQGTRLPPRWGRRAMTDDAANLHFQGFTSSERWGRAEETRRREPATAAVKPTQRLAEVYALSSRPPDAFETAIELPFRLMLSPAQDATWTTSSPRVRRDAHLPEDVNEFRELWTARLTGRDQADGVRAVWSPDFRPEALLSTQAPGAPPMGSYAPWALPRSYGLRRSPDKDLERFRTGLEAFDRHELVVLSSVHGLPVLGRRGPSGDLAPDADQIEPPQAFRLQGVLPEKYADQDTDMTAIYRPKPLSVTELSLSALGGNLDIDAGFQPPASARADGNGLNLFDALSVERWRQRTVLGRDIVVEVVYKGFLFPLGHRASLVKLTERRFMTVPGRVAPVAILVQRLFLRVGNREKRFQAEGQANRGSRWPCDRITILTRQTPDLVDAREDQTSSLKEGMVTPRGKIALGDGTGGTSKTTGLCIWPRTSSRPGAEVWFEMQVGDEAVPVRLPLIFVDNVAANDETTVAALIKYYNNNANVPDVAGTSPTKRLLRNGQPVVMAPEFKPGDTTFETQWWRVTAEGREANTPLAGKSGNSIVIDNTKYTRDSFMEGQDQPPFYPVVDGAFCRLKSVERFTGSGPLWAQVGFDGEYVARGFVEKADAGREAQSEIYLRILKDADTGADTLPLDFGNRGDMGGGVARPTMDIVAISRSLGPINGGTAGKPPATGGKAAPPDTLPPPQPYELPVLERIKRFEDSISIFPKGKFLGIMELSALVEKALGINLHPKLLEAVEYGAASALGSAVEGAANAVKEAAGDVRSALTKALIAPATGAVTEVQNAWQNLARQRLGSSRVPSLAEIYPQVGTDIASLKGLLEDAQTPSTPDDKFFELLAAINQAARRLTRTIDAIARDPLAAAAGAQVELFKKLIEPFDEVRKAIDSFGQLKTLPESLPKLILAAAKAAALNEVNRRVGPAVAAVPEIAAAISDAVNASLPNDWTIDTLANFPGVLAANLRKGVAPLPSGVETAAVESVADKLDEAEKGIQAAKDAVARAKSRLNDLKRQIESTADSALKDRVAVLQSEVNEAGQRQTDQAVEILLSHTMAQALRIAADAAKIWKDLPSSSLNLDSLPTFLAALAPALDILSAIGQGKLVTNLFTSALKVCAAARSALDTGAKALLPATSELTGASDCFVDADPPVLANSCAASTALTAVFNSVNTAVTALDNLPEKTPRDKINQAAAAVFAATEKLRISLKAFTDQINAIRRDACARPKPEIVAAIRDVVAQQRVLTETMEALVDQVLDAFSTPTLSRELRIALVNILVSALEHLPKLTLAGNLPNLNGVFDAFAGAVSALANEIRPILPATGETLDGLAAEFSNRKALTEAKSAVDQARAALAETLFQFESGKVGSDAFTGPVEAAKSRFLLLQETAIGSLERALTKDLLNLLAPAVDAVNSDLTTLMGTIAPIAGEGLTLLDRLYDVVLEQRRRLEATIGATTAVVARVLDALARELNAGPDRSYLFKVFAKEDVDLKNERLAYESKLVKDAAAKWKSADQAGALVALGALSEVWRQAALVELLRRFGKINGAFLRVIVVEALDLRALRQELDRIVRELVPTRATLSYDLSTPVRKFGLPGVGDVFLPVNGTRLDIKTRASINLLQPSTPDARVDGHMGPFGIRLFGNLDVVLLNFRGLDFRAGSGRSSGFDVRFGDFVIGDKAKFLKQLEPYVSPKAGLPPVRPMKDKPGIEATYGINLGSFGVGTLSFSNVTLNAGARLPFGPKDEAEFIVSIGRSDAPFLISSTIFGGGGYLALLANGKGFIGLETSFDYGGVFTFGFGPLSGTGQITLGLYFRAARGEPSRLGMNFMARGAANIACFSFSASLFVRLTYVGGKMDGQATYTFSFSIGIDDLDFTFDVYVNQGSGAGQGAPTAMLDLPGMPATTQFAGSRSTLLDAYAMAAPGSKSIQLDTTPPTLRVRVPSQKNDWRGYHKLFNPDLTPVFEI